MKREGCYRSEFYNFAFLLIEILTTVQIMGSRRLGGVPEGKARGGKKGL